MKMRVTTQMLNETARRAGLPGHTTSLLDYVNNTVGSSGNSLLDALNHNSGTGSARTSSVQQKSSYEKLEKAADDLGKKTEIFLAEGEDSVFEKAKKSGKADELYQNVEDLVDFYNNTLGSMKTVTGTLNSYYRQMLKEAAQDNQEALSGIGITLSKDGTLNLDRDKMKAAGAQTIEKVLGPSSEFLKKAAFLAGRISDNAAANKESVSSQYNAKGNTYSALNNQYDFRG